MKSNSIKIINSSKKTLTMILEPWAEEYKITLGKVIELVGDKPIDSSVEIEFDGEDIIVYGWADNIDVYCDGQKIDPEFD